MSNHNMLIKNFPNFILNIFKLHYNEVLLSILLIFSLVIRIANFETNTFTNPDGNSLYLVVSHIVKYKEFPLVGASTGYIQTFKKSPLYYYFSALLLGLNDNILFLEIANIFTSILIILVVYLLAKQMFGQESALIAATLFSFSQFAFQQSIFFILDTFLTEGLILLSLLLLLISYRKKSFAFLLGGIFIYALSVSFYFTSAFFILPVIILIIFYVLKKQKRKLSSFIFAFGFLALALFLFFLPVLIYQIDNHTLGASLFLRKGLISSADFFPEIASLFYILFDGYFINLDKALLSLNNILFLFIMGSLMYLTLGLKGLKKEFYFLIFVFLLTPILIITLLQINRPFYDPQSMPVYGLLRYFLPSVVFFIILIADVINSTFLKNFFSSLTKIFVILTLIFISFPNLKSYLNNLSEKISQKIQYKQTNNPSTDAIKKEVLRLKAEKQFNDFHFFQILLIGKVDSQSFVYDTPALWVELERELNTNLVKVDNQSIYTYKPLGEGKAIFLLCFGYSDDLDEKTGCVDKFKDGNTNFLLKKIYSKSPYSIYLTTKEG